MDRKSRERRFCTDEGDPYLKIRGGRVISTSLGVRNGMRPWDVRAIQDYPLIGRPVEPPSIGLSVVGPNLVYDADDVASGADGIIWVGGTLLIEAPLGIASAARFDVTFRTAGMVITPLLPSDCTAYTSRLEILDTSFSTEVDLPAATSQFGLPRVLFAQARTPTPSAGDPYNGIIVSGLPPNVGASFTPWVPNTQPFLDYVEGR